MEKQSCLFKITEIDATNAFNGIKFHTPLSELPELEFVMIMPPQKLNQPMIRCYMHPTQHEFGEVMYMFQNEKLVNVSILAIPTQLPLIKSQLEELYGLSGYNVNGTKKVWLGKRMQFTMGNAKDNSAMIEFCILPTGKISEDEPIKNII